MHSSSMENMQKCYERYICSDYYSTREKFAVLDVGGANVNGSYRDIFSSKKFTYEAADIEHSEFVDIVLEDPYCFPIPDGAFDVVISGQALEHSENFWLVFQEMTRVVKEDGWIILIVPSAGPIHRYPVDCYRFYPDSLVALAREAQINVIDLYIDNRGQWKDLVGVFSKTEDNPTRRNDSWRPLSDGQKNSYASRYQQIWGPSPNSTPEMEVTKGSVSKYGLIELIHDWIQPSLYLEIGVWRGKSLEKAKCDSIAIDPNPECSEPEFPKTNFYQMPSDYYFDHFWPTDQKHIELDLAFIDGMHLFENALRDFMNIERRSSSHTVVLVDDIFPNHPMQAERVRTTSKWTGDVWKFLVCLLELRPDLEITTFDAEPTGLLLIRDLNSSSNIFSDCYESIIQVYGNKRLTNYHSLILDRKGSVSLPVDELPKFFSTMDKKRDRGVPAPTALTEANIQLVRENAKKITAMKKKYKDAQREVVKLKQQNALLKKSAATMASENERALRKTVAALKKSLSWRITAPLRTIADLVLPKAIKAMKPSAESSAEKKKLEHRPNRPLFQKFFVGKNLPSVSLRDFDVVMVHYVEVVPTVATLNAFFRHYPEMKVTLVDNSGGRCSVATEILPHLSEHKDKINVLVNPAKTHGWMYDLCHGAGIDLALANTKKDFLVSIEADTFFLARGGLEYLAELANEGFDWGGYGQKPYQGKFGSVSPSFAFLRVEPITKLGLSMRTRYRMPGEVYANDIIMNHHLEVVQNLYHDQPVGYLDGKPPDTYRLNKWEIIDKEKAHLSYFDTGEAAHYGLLAAGYKCQLFEPIESVRHVWNSRDKQTFLENFAARLPNIAINEYLPDALHT